MSVALTSVLSNVVALDSSSLASVAYDVKQTILQVEFRDGSVYQYSNVPEKIHQNLLQASSKGAYLNCNIRNRFPSLKLRSRLARRLG